MPAQSTNHWLVFSIDETNNRKIILGRVKGIKHETALFKANDNPRWRFWRPLQVELIAYLVIRTINGKPIKTINQSTKRKQQTTMQKRVARNRIQS